MQRWLTRVATGPTLAPQYVSLPPFLPSFPFPFVSPSFLNLIKFFSPKAFKCMESTELRRFHMEGCACALRDRIRSLPRCWYSFWNFRLLFPLQIHHSFWPVRLLPLPMPILNFYFILFHFFIICFIYLFVSFRRTVQSIQFSIASDNYAMVYVNGLLVDSDPSPWHQATYWNR